MKLARLATACRRPYDPIVSIANAIRAASNRARVLFAAKAAERVHTCG